jgi:molybdenum cofactor biosynthesis protein B
MPYADHQQQAAGVPVRCAVITCSDTRTEATDKSGTLARTLLADAGHAVTHYALLPDDPRQITAAIKELAEQAVADVIVCNGGTGISRRDSTIDSIAGLITRRLPGFGELFRMLSWQQVRSGAMLSRAEAGVIDAPAGGTLVFALPGSPAAVDLAMRELILPELHHLVFELRRGRAGGA